MGVSAVDFPAEFERVRIGLFPLVVRVPDERDERAPQEEFLLIGYRALTQAIDSMRKGSFEAGRFLECAQTGFNSLFVYVQEDKADRNGKAFRKWYATFQELNKKYKSSAQKPTNRSADPIAVPAEFKFGPLL